MNLKPNLWTLLFVLTVGAGYYNIAITNVKSADNKYQISSEKYNDIRHQFLAEKEMLRNRFSKGEDDHLIDQILPTYFVLEKEELDLINKEMLNDLDGKIYLMTVWGNFRKSEG